MSANYFYVLTRDDNPDDPREDQDWLGTMACWHRSYKLGDEQPKCDPEEHIRNLVGWDEEKEEAILNFWYNKYQAARWRENIQSGEDLWDVARSKVKERIAEEFDRLFISLPTFLYDHGGISMSTGGFSCPWDSGQVGFIYVSREKVCEEYRWKVITKKREEKIRGYLRDEVKVYDQYLTGDVYGYKVYEALPGLREALSISDDDLQDFVEDIDLKFCEEVDSCWGFYGEESAKEEAESSVRYHEEHHEEVLVARQQGEARRAGQLSFMPSLVVWFDSGD
jgi:hypothetical protein